MPECQKDRSYRRELDAECIMGRHDICRDALCGV